MNAPVCVRKREQDFICLKIQIGILLVRTGSLLFSYQSISLKDIFTKIPTLPVRTGYRNFANHFTLKSYVKLV